jgi:hypothetical protein
MSSMSVMTSGQSTGSFSRSMNTLGTSGCPKRRSPRARLGAGLEARLGAGSEVGTSGCLRFDPASLSCSAGWSNWVQCAGFAW